MSQVNAIHPVRNDNARLDHEELTDVIDLAVWAGQLLLQHGADAERVEKTIHYMSTALGCNWVDVLVSPNAILVTSISGQEFRTKLRRVPTLGVDMTIVSGVSRLSRRVVAERLDRFTVRAELERISSIGHHYNRWVVVGMVGLACGAFSQLFGGDAPVFLVTTGAAAAAMFVRQEMTRRYFNPFLVVVATAFAAGFLASAAVAFDLGTQPQLALAASVLLLVPGVPLINAAQDLLKGHVVIGFTRGLIGLMVALAIALGLLLAMKLAGVNSL
jgi:uncharacterized membrane protein YjjP (DUF1212 family)